MTTTTEQPLSTRNPIFIEDEDTIATTSIKPDKGTRPAALRFADLAVTGQPSHSVVLGPHETAERRTLEKLFWSVSNQAPLSLGYVVRIEVSIEQLGFPGDAIASEAPWPSFWTQPHPFYRSRPGVLFIIHRRPTIFEQCLVIPTASLPWWKPQITLTRRLFGKRND